MPGPQMQGYEADVIGGGQGGDIRREQEASTDAEIMTVSLLPVEQVTSVRERILCTWNCLDRALLQLIKHFACHVEIQARVSHAKSRQGTQSNLADELPLTPTLPCRSLP
jgi:hypothetical protein